MKLLRISISIAVLSASSLALAQMPVAPEGSPALAIGSPALAIPSQPDQPVLPSPPAPTTQNEVATDITAPDTVQKTADTQDLQENEPKDSRSALRAMIEKLQVPESTELFKPSYGTIDTTIVFEDADVDLMRETLERVEKITSSGGLLGPSIEQRKDVAGIPQSQAPVEIPELDFKAYYVSSIIYRGPKDWMIWLNSERVTPKRNKGRVRVVAVGPDYVRLSWWPKEWDNRYLVWKNKEPYSPELKKIIAKDASSYLDVQTKSIHATLRPNQTWVTLYPVVVEGNHSALSAKIKPEFKELTPEEKLAGIMPQLSTKEAFESVNKAIKEKDKQINSNSQTSINEEGRGISNSGGAAVPAAPQVTPQVGVIPPSGGPVVTPQLPTAASLNDILNAVGAAAPQVPSPNATSIAPVAPITPPAPPTTPIP